MAGGDPLPDKSRDGAKVRKRGEKSATPCDRVLRRDDVGEDTKQRLRNSRLELDPVSLLHTIREAQTALASIRDSAPVSASTNKSLENFLGRLSDLWIQGEVRATHEVDAQKARKLTYSGRIPTRSKECVAKYWTVFSASRTPRTMLCWIR